MPPNWATGRAGEQGKDTPASKPFKGRMGDEAKASVEAPHKCQLNADDNVLLQNVAVQRPVHAAPDRCIFRCVTKR